MRTVTPFERRTDGKWLLSRKPTAIKRDSWLLQTQPQVWGKDPAKQQKGLIWYASVTVITVRGTTAHPSVTFGTLGQSGVQADWRWDEMPNDLDDFMLHYADSWNGVTALATWNGSRIWTHDGQPDSIKGGLEILEPALDFLPVVPTGYDGWWHLGQKVKR